MAEESKMLDAPGADQDPERDEALIPPSETDIEKVQPPGRSRFLGLQDRLERFEKSAAGRYWAHLSTADFMNSSFAFAALAVLSAFPYPRGHLVGHRRRHQNGDRRPDGVERRGGPRHRRTDRYGKSGG